MASSSESAGAGQSASSGKTGQLGQHALGFVGIEQRDRHAGVHHDVVADASLGHAGHVTAARNAAEFDLGHAPTADRDRSSARLFQELLSTWLPTSRDVVPPRRPIGRPPARRRRWE